MKIVAIIGSLRKQSYNRSAYNAYAELLTGQAEIVEGRIDQFPMYNDDVREAGMPAVVTELAALIRSADGVIFFSPEYNYSVPGVLKNAIDWLSRVPEQPFAGKTAAIVSASPGKLGGARMQYHLRQIAVFLDLQLLNRPEVMISEVHKKIDQAGKLTDETTRKFLATHIEKFLEVISRAN